LLETADGSGIGSKTSAAERAYLQASVYALVQRYDEAIRSYRQALALRPQEVAWHYELATLLLQRGMLDEALDHARTCARMDIHNPQYRILLERIHDKRFRGDVGELTFPDP
jgi:tetratricopeptide (TPR) repeat protein